MNEQHNEWRHVAVVYEVDACRFGWPGVWDAIKAALSGMNRPVAPRPYTVEFWVMAKDAGLRSNEQHVREKQVYLNGVMHRGVPYELPPRDTSEEDAQLAAQAEAEHLERTNAMAARGYP